MALFTYLIAFGHFFSELFIYKTAGLSFGTISPVIVSSALHSLFLTSRGHERLTRRVAFPYSFSYLYDLDVPAVRLLC